MKLVSNPLSEQSIMINLTSAPEIHHFDPGTADGGCDTSLAIRMGSGNSYHYYILNTPSITIVGYDGKSDGYQIKQQLLSIGSSYIDFTGSNVDYRPSTSSLHPQGTLTPSIIRDGKWHRIEQHYEKHDEEFAAFEYKADNALASADIYKKPYTEFRYIDKNATLFQFKYDGYSQWDNAKNKLTIALRKLYLQTGLNIYLSV